MPFNLAKGVYIECKEELAERNVSILSDYEDVKTYWRLEV
jgi:hypothetical protein